MTHFQVKQSEKLDLTSYSGLALVGQCLEAAEMVEVIDRKLPVRAGMPMSDIFKAAVGLLCLGKSDFAAIEPLREDRFFREALGLRGKAPSAVWLRQRMNQAAVEAREETDACSVRLLERTGAPVTPVGKYVCLDLDTFVMDQSGSKKELVSRTYRGVDGYTPIAAYLGNEGWCLALELREGKQHSALETEYTLERVWPRVQRLVPAGQPVLTRLDSGFDSARLLLLHAREREQWAAQGRSFDYVIKWNPRRQNKAEWVRRAEAAQAFTTLRDGKREAWLTERVERAFAKQRCQLRLIVRVVERTIDARGQGLLQPEVELEGWWTSLEDTPEAVVAVYRQHGTHEQFHSEIKSDLDLERLPSGKFDTNDLMVHLAMLAYNCLRLIGQIGLAGKDSPLRHPAQRRRLKTVLQEVIYRAAQFVTHARQRALNFGRAATAHVAVFLHVRDYLRRCLAT